MPLPLGHAAIGWAAYETVRPSPGSEAHSGQRFPVALIAMVTILTNLPDLDVLFGLLFYGNGMAVHRGPTHSLLFALLAGYCAANLWRLWPRIPRLGFGLCFMLVLSHVVADMLLTSAPVSLLWPLEHTLISGYRGWGQVVNMVMYQSIQDFGIIATSFVYIYGLRFIRAKAPLYLPFAFPRRRAK